jgi:hypothetical protein
MSAGPYSQWEIDVMKRAADATSEERWLAADDSAGWQDFVRRECLL